LPAKYPSQACSCMQLLALIFEIAVHSVHPKKEGTLHNVHTLRARNGVAKLAELRLAGLPHTAIAATRSTMSTRREPASRGPLARGPGLGQRAVSAAVGRLVSVGTAPVPLWLSCGRAGCPQAAPAASRAANPLVDRGWLAVVAHASLGRSGTPGSAAVGGPVNALTRVAPASCWAARHRFPSPRGLGNALDRTLCLASPIAPQGA